MKKWSGVERTPEFIRDPPITSDIYLQLSQISEDIKKNSHYAFGTLLDVGAGKAPYSPFFKHTRYIKLDSFKNGCPDIFGDALNLPIKNSVVDTVFSSQLLEHVPYPQKVVDEFYRVLKTGGVCICTTHMANPLHGMPYDYFRFTREGLKVLFKNFEIVKIKENGGAVLSILQFICWGVSLLPYFIGLPVIFILNIFGKHLDRLFFDSRFTTNYILIARKVKNENIM